MRRLCDRTLTSLRREPRGASGRLEFRDVGGFRAGALYEQRDIGPTFGSNGEETTAFGTNEATICGLAIQTNGNIVVVVTSLASNKTGGLVVARYLGQ
jgi:hypothetical protein